MASVDQLSSSYTLLTDTDNQERTRIYLGSQQQDCGDSTGDCIELKQAGTLAHSGQLLPRGNGLSGNAQRATTSEADLQLQGTSTAANQEVRQVLQETESCLREEDSISPHSSLSNSAGTGEQTPRGILRKSQPLRESSCETGTLSSSLLRNSSSIPVTTLDNDNISRQVSFVSASSFPEGKEGLLIQQGERGDEDTDKRKQRYSNRQHRPPLKRYVKLFSQAIHC